MGKTNKKEFRFELKADCVCRGGSSTIKVNAKGGITSVDKLRVIARTFDAMVENDTKHDREMIAGILYEAMMKNMSAGEYLDNLMRSID